MMLRTLAQNATTKRARPFCGRALLTAPHRKMRACHDARGAWSVLPRSVPHERFTGACATLSSTFMRIKRHSGGNLDIDQRNKVIVVIGTRPEAIKLAPVVLELE